MLAIRPGRLLRDVGGHVLPVESDLLNSAAMKGASVPLKSFTTSHVGTGSSWHVLFGAEAISCSTSSAVTAVQKLPSVDAVALYGTSYNGVVAVVAQTAAILSFKKCSKVISGMNSSVIPGCLAQ